MTEEHVGRVLGSEHTRTAEFRVVLEDDQFLQLDDLVVVRTLVPKAGEVRTYGVVTEAEAIYEGAQYESDTHRIAELGIMPAQKVRTARVAVTRVDPEVWVSADPGETVDRATGEERSRALYADQMERPLPVGLGRDGLPVHIDLDFFDGRKGGHMSIAGISGVATKTSFALFFLRVLTASPSIVGEGGREPARAGLQRQGRGSAVARQAQPAVRTGRGRGRGVGRDRCRAGAVPQRPVLGAAAPGWRRPDPRHGRTARGDRRLRLDSAGVRRPRAAGVLLHRRERREEPAARSSASASSSSSSGSRPTSRACRARSRCATRATSPTGVGAGRSPPARRGGSSPTSRRWSRRSRSSSIPTRASPTRPGRAGCSSRPSRPSCGGMHAAASRVGHLVRAGTEPPDRSRRRQRHGRRDPVAARAGAAVRRRCAR